MIEVYVKLNTNDPNGLLDEQLEIIKEIDEVAKELTEKYPSLVDWPSFFGER